MRNKNFSVIVTPPYPDRRFSTLIRRFEKDLIALYSDMERKSLVIIKQETPKKSGAVAASWITRRSNDGANGTDIELHNPNQVASFLNTGTKPSLGRYVPVLNRRITTGIHPGIKGTKYIDRASQMIKDLTTEEINKLVAKVKLDTGRAFPIVG